MSRILSYIKRKRHQYLMLKMFGLQTYKWGYKKGFTKSTIRVCGITKDNYKEFISDIDYYSGHPYNGMFTSIIDNKLYLPMMLHNYKMYLPDYYCFIDENGILPLDDFPNKNGARVDTNTLFSLLAIKKNLVLKHVCSSSGNGFMKISQKDDKLFLNNKSIQKEDLKKKILSLRNYIVTEYVIQHSYSSEICSSSLNTLRFLYIWDDRKKEFFLARCFHRFGCNGSNVDNFHAGNGLLIGVNTESGVISHDGYISSNDTKGISFIESSIHPDQNIQLAGIVIPRFNQVKEQLLAISNEHSYLKIIGYDVAITEDSFKIIEINSLSGLEWVQQKKGFLTDSRIAKILKK